MRGARRPAFTLLASAVAVALTVLLSAPGAAQLNGPIEPPFEPPFEPGFPGGPGMGPGGPGPQPGPEDFPRDPRDTLDREFYEVLAITLDVLPIAVIYHPPGAGVFPDPETGHQEPVGQEIAITQRFATSARVTRATTEGSVMSLSPSAPDGLPFEFSAKIEGTQESAEQTETGTWRVFFSTSTWSSGPGEAGGPDDLFPGDGDKIAFFLSPSFEMTYQTGEMRDGMLRMFEPPILVAMKPIALPWIDTQATIWDLRTGRLDDILDRSTVDSLLALDPFVSFGPQSAGSGFRLNGMTRLRKFASPSGVDSDPELSGPRFVLQGSPTISSCGWADRTERELVEGEYSSTTTTYRHTSRTVVTLLGDTSVTFEYSMNQRTEQEHSTDAVAYYGGGGDCDGPLLYTEVWYDTTFGTLAFPTGETPPANVMGAVQGGNVSGQEIVVENSSGDSLHARTDATGHYRLYLEPGHYRVLVRRGRQPQSQPIEFDVPAGQAGVVRPDPLELGSAGERRLPPDRGLDVVTPTPTPAVRLPERDTQVATPTPTPDIRETRPGPFVPTPTSTPDRPDIRPGPR